METEKLSLHGDKVTLYGDEIIRILFKITLKNTDK